MCSVLDSINIIIIIDVSLDSMPGHKRADRLDHGRHLLDNLIQSIYITGLIKHDGEDILTKVQNLTVALDRPLYNEVIVKEDLGLELRLPALLDESLLLLVWGYVAHGKFLHLVCQSIRIHWERDRWRLTLTQPLTISSIHGRGRNHNYNRRGEVKEAVQRRNATISPRKTP